MFLRSRSLYIAKRVNSSTPGHREEKRGEKRREARRREGEEEKVKRRVLKR